MTGPSAVSREASPGRRLFAGVMTGTSLDAIDVAIVAMDHQITLGHVAPTITLEHFHSRPLDQPLRDAMMGLQSASEDELHRAALVSNILADAISRTVLEALALHGIRARDITAVGVHGQTIRHQPQLGYSIQLNAPSRIAETTGITVVSDFRSRDIAAGGQGAPLVPAFHQAVFGHEPSVRAVVNIGGIANITWLGKALVGYDTGPGNLLMDLWMQTHQGMPFDANGQWAASGRADEGLLAAMLADPFFMRPPPKSTGRDLFSAQWLQQILQQPAHTKIAPQDVQATLLHLTAQSIAQEMGRIQASHADSADPSWSRLLVCGGGAQNTALMQTLQQRISAALQQDVAVESTDACGWDPQVIEAAAFAWLASRAIDGLPGNSPGVTGALGDRILGSISPA